MKNVYAMIHHGPRGPDTLSQSRIVGIVPPTEKRAGRAIP